VYCSYSCSCAVQARGQREQFLAKMEFVDGEMMNLGLSNGVQRKVKSFLKYLWVNHHGSMHASTTRLHDDPDLSNVLKQDVLGSVRCACVCLLFPLYLPVHLP
jgi:hypothetical protein